MNEREKKKILIKLFMITEIPWGEGGVRWKTWTEKDSFNIFDYIWKYKIKFVSTNWHL